MDEVVSKFKRKTPLTSVECFFFGPVLFMPKNIDIYSSFSWGGHRIFQGEKPTPDLDSSSYLSRFSSFLKQA